MPPEGNENQTAPPQQQTHSGGGEPTPQREMISLSPAAFDERIRRAQESAITNTLKGLGFTTADEVKAALEAARTLQATLDEVTGRESALKTQLEETLGKFTQLDGEVKDGKRRGVLLRLAEGAKHPEDVITWVRETAPDDYAAILKEDGTLDEEKAKALVGKCVEARGDWFRKSGNPGSVSVFNRQADPTPQTPEQKRLELIKAARDKKGF